MNIKRVRIFGAGIFGTLSLLVFFNNCGRVGFGMSEDSLNSLGVHFSSQYVMTKKNTPVDFKLDNNKLNAKWVVSFSSERIQNYLHSEKGTYQITNGEAFAIHFPPKENFIGTEEIEVFLKDPYGIYQPLKINMTIGNVLSSIQPALAIRAIGCVSCHAQVASNFVTDLGYGGNGKGLDYFFNSPSPWYSNFYGDHGGMTLDANNNAGTFRTMKFSNNAQVIVPKARTPATVVGSTGAENVAAYFNLRLKSSPFPSSQFTTVREMDLVKISAPSEARIKEVFKVTAGEAYKYINENQYSPALSGLQYNAAKKVFTLSGPLVCDGDLFLDGTLFLDHAVVKSLQGCRLYVTGSVFIANGLTSEPADNLSELHNIQISSARAIVMGSGSLTKNGVYCETEGWYKTSHPESTANSLTIRVDYFKDHRGFVRSYTPEVLNGLVKQEAANLGQELFDATCEEKGRDVAFSRLLLNAPWVMSRYRGNVQGSIVAEAALMALGNFKFSFDPVFKNVTVLAMLDGNEIIDIR